MGFEVFHKNTSIFFTKSSNFVLAFFVANFVTGPKNYSTIIVHSTSGLGRVALLRFFHPNVNIIYYCLSKVNPSGGPLKYSFRKVLQKIDIWSSSTVVFGLNDLFVSNGSSRKSIYLPFFSDCEFFEYQLHISSNQNFKNRAYILIVGDSTRDDAFAYAELHNLDLPIIRVTRDERVIIEVKKLMNVDRGDRVLSGVSFCELANLYNNAFCSIVASKYDDWQPGGITSMVEALACSSICIANGGGEIQREFDFLAKRSGIENPILFYNYPTTGTLTQKLNILLNTSDSDYLLRKNESSQFAKRSFNMRTDGFRVYKSEITRNFR
jgi:hypothetical protein